ncbi:uncharacterized protein MEPE_03215 [Melanopsichium pennsylvanicum]|uniref:DUF7888 domain-containing protein n=1 Tax=Melanopsichium pennsylvanicum TaxID=63383 RepID=A0AAJ4XMH6_9BASI|nr:uncharacterized protein MEPE_03215 [Melanopsichium pennsylvanicum]
MTFNKTFTVLLLCASIMLADGSILDQPEDSKLVQRNFKDCATARVNYLWDHKPQGALAAICYSGKYELHNYDAKHLKRDDPLVCSQKSFWKIHKKNRYDCFYLLKENEFRPDSAVDDDNLQVQYSDDHCYFFEHYSAGTWMDCNESYRTH